MAPRPRRQQSKNAWPPSKSQHLPPFASISRCLDRHGLDLRGLRVEVEKEMSAGSPRRIARVRTKIFVPLPADHPQRVLLENAARTCPVHHSLHPEVDKPVEFQWS